MDGDRRAVDRRRSAFFGEEESRLREGGFREAAVRFCPPAQKEKSRRWRDWQASFLGAKPPGARRFFAILPDPPTQFVGLRRSAAGMREVFYLFVAKRAKIHAIQLRSHTNCAIRENQGWGAIPRGRFAAGKRGHKRACARPARAKDLFSKAGGRKHLRSGFFEESPSRSLTQLRSGNGRCSPNR